MRGIYFTVLVQASMTDLRRGKAQNPGGPLCILLLVPPLGSHHTPGHISLSVCSSGGDTNPSPFHYIVVATCLYIF